MTKEFKKEVKREMDLIILHQTKEKINKLDFSELDSSDSNLCIYGQMEGCCDYQSAIDLFSKTCRFMYRCLDYLYDLEEIDTKLNYKESIKEFCFSPLEVYIYQAGAKNEDVIKYLKGEIKTIEL